MQQVVYILSNIHKALQYEWTAKLMDKSAIDLRFILLQKTPHTPMQQCLTDLGVPHKTFLFTSRKQYPKLLWQIYQTLNEWKPQVVHTHLMDASFLGLLAARLQGVPVRIHTRHHAIENHQLSQKAVWLDKRINALSTHIITISPNVTHILTQLEGVPQRKLVFIPHGFQLQSLQTPDAAYVAQLRQKHNLQGAYPVIGVISRFLKLKGIDYTIASFGQLLQQYPQAVLLFAGAAGDYEAAIDQQLAQLPAHSWRKIGFEDNLPALYALLDMHVHVPIARESESFGQTYIEALAAGVPAVFTLSGIAPEVIRHKQNAWVVPHCDSDAILEAMHALLADETLRNKLIAQGQTDVLPYSMEQMVNSLVQLYTKGYLQKNS